MTSNLPPNVTDAMIEKHFGDPICECGHHYSDHEELDQDKEKCWGCKCKKFKEKIIDKMDFPFKKRHKDIKTPKSGE